MWLDPQSGQRLHIHGYEQRRWRHLPTMQFETIIVAQVPRLSIPMDILNWSRFLGQTNRVSGQCFLSACDLGNYFA
jgi:zinc-finger of transposase IS204/IS1001/IS1096/IS1165